MNCQECGKHEATVHFTQMINGKKTEMQLCKICAAKKGFSSSLGTVENIVSKIVSDHNPQADTDGDMLVCEKCNTSYQDFQRTGRLGCSNCYAVFEDNLKDLLRKIHGSIQHVGKVPPVTEKNDEEQESLTELRVKMKEAIKHEEFEEAAVLRDRIKKLKGEDS